MIGGHFKLQDRRDVAEIARLTNKSETGLGDKVTRFTSCKVCGAPSCTSSVQHLAKT